MYVRKKRIKGNDYFYLVESNFNQMQKHLKYLGKELDNEYKLLYGKRKKRNAFI